MQVAKYWRNKKLRYRLIRSMRQNKRDLRVSQSPQLDESVLVQLTRDKIAEIAG